ncbi:MFS transporter [Corynebacterium kroppenstedtii]|uniref:MFS transporter n=1 Tax=Corynebacterium sp. PCR 32 TaxID=3351342 RepID=UPI0030954540
MGSRRALFALIALSIGGFGIGTTEFVSMGLLKHIGATYNISDGAAGGIITAYAMGVVVGAPLITALTGAIPRRRLLLLLMGAFTVGNGLSIAAPNYTFLMAARFIAGIPHGAFFGVASLVAVSLSKPGRRGQAIAIVNLGLPIATLIGVPLAQAIGQELSWHYAYVMVSLIGLVTLISIWITVPHMTLMVTTNPLTELSALAKPQVLLTLLMGTVGFGGMFAVYTYISWTMTEVAGLPANLMWIVLMSYGLGMIIGTWFGGKLVDDNPERGIFISLITMTVILTAFFFTSHNPWLGTMNFAMIGMSGSLLTPNLQSRLMDTAGEAQTLASALNQSALNLANAGGAVVGGWVVSAGLGYSSGGLVGALMALLSMAVWAPAALARTRASARLEAV